MKKFVSVTLTGLIATQSFAQTLGDKLENTRIAIGDSAEAAAEQGLFLMELYSKKSILESISVAQEINAAVGLDQIADEHYFAVPLVAVGALYTSLHAYRATDFSIKIIQKIATPNNIEKFVKEAAELDRANKADKLRLSESLNQLSDYERKLENILKQKNLLDTQFTLLEKELTDILSSIDSIEKGLADGKYSTLQDKYNARRRLTQYKEAFEAKEKAQNSIGARVAKLSESADILVHNIEDSSRIVQVHRFADMKSYQKFRNHTTLISKKTMLRNAVSALGKAARGTLLLGGILVGVSIISDTVILTVGPEDMEKFKKQLESDIQALEATGK